MIIPSDFCPKHIFRKNLARALKVVLAELIESMDV